MTLSDQFRISSAWRETKAKRFAHDGRNAGAAKRLLELKSSIMIPDGVWLDFQPLVSNPLSLSAISETNRDVGFRIHPADFTAWLAHLRLNLTRD